MFVQQFFVRGLAHSSYLLGGTNTCAIIDPRRDVDMYLKAAKEMAGAVVVEMIDYQIPDMLLQKILPDRLRQATGGGVAR